MMWKVKRKMEYTPHCNQYFISITSSVGQQLPHTHIHSHLGGAHWCAHSAGSTPGTPSSCLQPRPAGPRQSKEQSCAGSSNELQEHSEPPLISTRQSWSGDTAGLTWTARY